MELETVRAVIALAEEHNLAELAVETDALSVRIVRVHAPAVSQPEVSATTVPANRAVGLRTIRAPMAGTFYRAPNPEALPFVKPGDAVTGSTVLCIIESMKMMNELQAQEAGTLVEVLVPDGTPVESGQPLFTLR